MSAPKPATFNGRHNTTNRHNHRDQVPRSHLPRTSPKVSRDTARPATRLLSGGRWEEVTSAIWQVEESEKTGHRTKHINLLQRQHSSRANRTQHPVPLKNDIY